MALAAVLVAIAGLVALVTASPAAAHGRDSDATNYTSEVTGGSAEGLSWRAFAGDELLEVVNTTDRRLVVFGADGAPMLRIGPDGVFENAEAPPPSADEGHRGAAGPGADAIGRDRGGQQPEAEASAPSTAEQPSAERGAGASPDWRRVAGGQRYAWHDHRIHWDGPGLPAGVRAEPGRAQAVADWAVPYRLAGDRAVVTGELRWVPPVSPWPWVLVAAVLTAPAAAGLVRRRGLAGLARPAALVVALVAAANVARVADGLIIGPEGWATALTNTLVTALFCVLGLAGARKAWRGGDGAFTALGVGVLALGLGLGVLALPVLSASGLSTHLPEAVLRLLVAASLTQVVFAGVVAVTGLRRATPATPVPASSERS